MSTQKSFGIVYGSKELTKFDVPVPKVGNHEVLLQVEAAGMCQSDLHILWIQDKRIPKKMVMGHEIAGKLVEVGSDLKNSPYKVGGRFCMTIPDYCGICDPCRRGQENQCSTQLSYGLSRDGGYQKYLLVKNLKTLIPIPDNVSYEAAAVATDSVLTPFHAIAKVRNRLMPTTKVLVIGLGGLGLNALQILKNYGCQIVAVDIKQGNEKLALDLGATEFYTDMSKSKHRPESFDLVFDVCGMQPTIDTAQKYVTSGGKIMMIGLSKARFTIQNYELARREIEIVFSFGGTSAEQVELLRWVSLGKINPLLTKAHIDELPQYLEKMAQGKVTGRMVFNPLKL